MLFAAAVYAAIAALLMTAGFVTSSTSIILSPSALFLASCAFWALTTVLLGTSAWRMLRQKRSSPAP